MTKTTNPVYPCHKGHDNVIHVPLNQPGEYVMFPSNTYHRGYYNSTIQKTFFTAQLFAEYKSSDDIHVSRNDNSQFYQLKHVLPCKLTALSNDLRYYWDIHYPASEYSPPDQYKLVDIDISSNRVVDKATFCNARPFLNDLVTMFEFLHPNLDFQLVWFIRKRDDGDGFQSWHKDLINNAKTAITIVVNVGSYPLESDTDDSTSISSSAYSNPEEAERVNAQYFLALENNRNLDRAREFYKNCRKIRDVLGSTMSPLDIALELDIFTRRLHNPCRGQYEDESAFNNQICDLLGIKEDKRCNLPPFILGEWFVMHSVYIMDPHFHSENIKKASIIEEHLIARRSRIVVASPDDDNAVEHNDEIRENVSDKKSNVDSGHNDEIGDEVVDDKSNLDGGNHDVIGDTLCDEKSNVDPGINDDIDYDVADDPFNVDGNTNDDIGDVVGNVTIPTREVETLSTMTAAIPATGTATLTANIAIPTAVPTLPGWKPNTWVCHKCYAEINERLKRCGNCKAWKNGLRQKKRTVPDSPPPDKGDPKKKLSRNKGRTKKKSIDSGMSAVVEVPIGGSTQDVSPYMSSPVGDIVGPTDDMSMSLNSISTVSNALGFNLEDGDDNTVTRVMHDEKVLRLQEEDDNYMGDGGTSDAEGEGYDIVEGFRDNMKAAHEDRLMNGEDDVEEGLEDTEDNATSCLVTDNDRRSILSSLYGAPPGWKPPAPEDGWTPPSLKPNELPFDEVDNPGQWSKYTFRAVFEKQDKRSTGKYLHHAMPSGAVPIPEDPITKKRVHGGYEFFYQGWKHPNPTKFNCRLGSDMNTVFPEGREVQLDAVYLKKMGLTKKRMEDCDALFFYQLLVPIANPAFSGIKDDMRMGYYEEVANNTNQYAYGFKQRGGTRGHSFFPVVAEELVIWDGIVIRNLSDNIGDCWLKNQSNTYDREVAESMRFRRWIDIKTCMKQNVYFQEKKRDDEGYDPTQKYRLIWDVICHNMNQMILVGGLDLTGDETSWPNSSYADVHSNLIGKKTDKGGQHVLLLDARRRYMYAWTPRHSFFPKNKDFTALGPAEIVRLVEIIEPLMVGAHKEEGDTRRQIFHEPVHITMDNYFSGDNILKYLGERGYKATMTCRRDRLPEGVPKTAFHFMKGVKVDHRTRVARFEQPVVAVKHVTHPTGSGKKDYTLTHVSFQSTGGTNISSVNALSENVLYVKERKKGRGEQQRRWAIEMCNARDLYLKNYSAVDKIDQALINWRVTYRSWRWWHAPMRHGKAIAMSMAYQIYLQCAEGGVDPEWKVRPVSGPMFKHKMSLQMVTYKAKNLRYPGDEKMRGSTQTGKRYRGTNDDGVAIVTLDNNTKRVHYDKYLDMKMPKERLKKSRLCSDNMTLLKEHINSMVCKHKAKCQYCGKLTFMVCTLCGVHVCFKDSTNQTSLSCVLHYHDDDYYGIGMEDRRRLFGVPERDYKKPSAKEISENRTYMQGLRRRYQEALENMK